MDAGRLRPSMALALIAQGKEQVVAIDHKTMLVKVMQELGAKEMPVFKEVDCGEQGVKVEIKLDVSCAKYSVGHKINTAQIEGEPSVSKELAEKNAVLKAMKHLSDKHLIKVLDYSSRVANAIEGNSAFGDVNAAMYSVEKLIAQWEGNIGKCKQLALKLQGKGSEQDGDREVYQGLAEFTEMMLDMFNEKMTTARARATDIEFARKKYHSRSTEKYHANLRKGYLQDVVLTTKEVLDYVLTYLGAGKAKYYNGPTSYGVMKGVVKFYMPCVEGIEYCGNLTFKGKCRRSISAEEEAAFQALRFMEKKYNLKIVDLNHGERVDSEKERKLLVHLLEQIIHVADDVKKYWGKMVTSMNTEKKAHSIDPTAIFSGPVAEKKIEAYKFCADLIGELASDSNKAYADCADRFEGMEKLEYKLNEAKDSLEMD